MKPKTKQAVRAAAIMASTRSQQIAAAADAALIRVGDAAKRRQRKRTRAATLKKAGKIALVAGIATATMLTARAVREGLQNDVLK